MTTPTKLILITAAEFDRVDRKFFALRKLLEDNFHLGMRSSDPAVHERLAVRDSRTERACAVL